MKIVAVALLYKRNHSVSGLFSLKMAQQGRNT
jgi:hypothetical protein